MSTNEQHSKIILAAGGIVEKQTDHGLKIAVIYRPRYGGEWNLPKGKVKDQESPLHAATREIEEETGCRVRVTDIAGFTHYYHNKTPKLVLYWRMNLENEGTFQPSEEVQMMEWLTPQVAMRRLSHAEEKSLVSKVYYGYALASRYGRKRILTALWYRLFGSARYDRLANTLYEYEVRLKWRTHQRDKLGNEDIEWKTAAEECLRDAKLALREFNYDRGWQCLHTAQSMEVWSYDNDELQNSSDILHREADKLIGWRKEAILSLLKHSDTNAQSQDESKLQRQVYQATLLKNEHFNNLYYKIGIRGWNLKIVFFTLAVVVVSLPVLAGVGVQTIGDWRTIIAVELFGILGASFSVASSLTKSSVETAIPQELIGSVVTWMRPVMGAAAAVAAYQLLRAGALPRIFNPELDPTLVYLTVAFIAGFSERLIIGTIEKVLPKEDQTRPEK